MIAACGKNTSNPSDATPPQNSGEEIVLADNPQALPICSGDIASADEWKQLDPAVNISGRTSNIGNAVMNGLHFNCAAQLRFRHKDILKDDGTCCKRSETTGLIALPKMSATPQTIFPQDGDDQRIFFSVDAPMVANFSPCYPGDSDVPNDYCTEEFYDSLGVTRSLGMMLYRESGEDGNFETSRWIVGRGVPNFIIKRVSANCSKSSRCEYQILFPKDATGSPTLKYDVQVIIQVSVSLDDIPESDNILGHSSAQAIPLLIKQKRD